MPPEHALVFHNDGYSKTQAKAAIYERALLAIERLSPPLRERALWRVAPHRMAICASQKARTT